MQLYSGLELTDNDYFGNALKTTLFGTNYAFSKLREKVNKTDWVKVSGMQEPPKKSKKSDPSSGLVTNSILFCSPFTIKDYCKKVYLQLYCTL